MSDRFHRPIAILAKQQSGWRWLPDTAMESAEAWLWSHRWVDSWVGYGIAFVAGFAAGWCLT